MAETMIDAAQNLAAASEIAARNWHEAQKWKRMAEKLQEELARRDACADVFIEVRRGTVIIGEGT